MGPLALTFPLTFFLSIYNLFFGLGVLSNWLDHKFSDELRPYKLPAFLLGNFLFLAAGCIENYWTGKFDGSVT